MTYLSGTSTKLLAYGRFSAFFLVILANSTYKPKKLKTNKTHLSLLVSWRVVTFIFETDYLSILSAHASVVPRSAVNSRSKPRRSFSTPLIRLPFPLLDPPTSSASCFFLSRLRAREQRITTRRRDFQPPNCRLFLVGHYPSFNSLSLSTAVHLPTNSTCIQTSTTISHSPDASTPFLSDLDRPETKSPKHKNTRRKTCKTNSLCLLPCSGFLPE